MGEMAFARNLLKGDPLELSRLRRAKNEPNFGVQIATNTIEEGRLAVVKAHEAGADWVDLNCGCPVFEATRRGLGSSLLSSPSKLAKLVAGIADDSPLPLSVKIRIAPHGKETNVHKVVGKVGVKPGQYTEAVRAKRASAPAGPCVRCFWRANSHPLHSLLSLTHTHSRTAARDRFARRNHNPRPLGGRPVHQGG